MLSAPGLKGDSVQLGCDFCLGRRFGHHEQLAQAFTAGVSPDTRDDKSYTLLMQCAMNGNMRCMKVCLRAAAAETPSFPPPALCRIRLQ